MKSLLIALTLIASVAANAKSITIFNDVVDDGVESVSFVKSSKNTVRLQAISNETFFCDDEDSDCQDVYYSNKLKNFTREGRDVYYVSGDKKLYCGKTVAMFKDSVIEGACSIEIKKVKTCTDYYDANDCVRYSTHYEVILNIAE